MLAVLARSASFVLFLGVYSVSLRTFIIAANSPPPQSRIEDRSGKLEEPPKKIPKSPKRTVWNLDGGILFSTDGHLQNGSCFRLSGQMTAPDFFDGLRRVDTADGTTYTLHDRVVTEYPPEVQITLHLLDFPCTTDLKDSAVRPPLTREIMNTLRLNFFWKEGIAMRPVESTKRVAADARPLAPYSTDAAAELAPRFEWNYMFTVASEGVPLTNDLVLIIYDQDRKIAARVAARL
jgi:hypothetical protein